MSNTQPDAGRVGIAHEPELCGRPPEKCYDDLGLIRRLVRTAMTEFGLGQNDPDVPLADIISPGQTVLLKPNWVYHKNQAPHGNASLVTHPEIVLQTLLEITAAKPARVILGDAPIQGCDWTRLITPEFRSRLKEIEAASGVTIDLVDFRRTVTKTENLKDGVEVDQRDRDRYVLFDLANDSWLEPVSDPRGRFRVTNYDPSELAKTHQPGRHQYLLCKEAFEADVVIQLPKLKTHRKTGVTGAIKNLVGLNGNKDYLPHHRVGGSKIGGDCYQGRNLRMRTVEWLLDSANRNLGRPVYGTLRKLADLQSRLIRKTPIGGLEGSWYGNDTCWRMVLDLNRILNYGTIDGELSDKRQRVIYSLTDAVVCGQGDGPLKPEPLTLGAVTFASNSVAADAVHCILLGIDPERIRLVSVARSESRWMLLDQGSVPYAAVDSRSVPLNEIRDTIGVNARLPEGWEGHVELEVPVR
ncbi:MAG: DUF362 domain-containing protein [Rubripirellula sp.]|nr:DUF362 domain-containing protein [Rubripirellula sp.]